MSNVDYYRSPSVVERGGVEYARPSEISTPGCDWSPSKKARAVNRALIELGLQEAEEHIVYPFDTSKKPYTIRWYLPTEKGMQFLLLEEREDGYGLERHYQPARLFWQRDVLEQFGYFLSDANEAKP